MNDIREVDGVHITLLSQIITSYMNIHVDYLKYFWMIQEKMSKTFFKNEFGSCHTQYTGEYFSNDFTCSSSLMVFQ